MKFFQLIPSDTNFDFLGKFKYFIALSLMCFAVIFWGLYQKGLNFGIDFTGGTVMQVRFAETKPAQDVRKLLEELGEPEASVVSLDKESKDYLVTTRSKIEEKGAARLSDRLVAKVGAGKAVIQSSDSVGPKVGAELKLAAMRSLFYAIILITVYIWFRFDFKFAPGATVAMVHDLIMATGFYVFTGSEFTITAIAALLTIAGYSVNDTIVIYDRVREMYKQGGDGLPLGQTINKAINLTLSRTVLTAAVTFISILPIITFATGEIRNFAIAMCFGIFVGCYSTIYIASPLTVWVEHWMHKRSNRPTGRTRPATA